MNKKQVVKFAPRGTPSFYDTVKERVSDYFTQNNISQYGNPKMYIKTAVMLSLYFVPYVFIATGLGSVNIVVFYLLWTLMGFGIVGIGTSVMHDSNHGSYTHSKFTNNFLGGVLNVIGGYAPNWKIQHNILHHTYTNLGGLDEDIDAGVMLRMHPYKPYRKFYRYQHLYCWFLYSLMNLFWVTVKDYKMIFRYNSNGLLKKENLTLTRALTELSLLKVFYIAYIIVIPILFSGMPWYHVVGGFVLCQVIGGLALACIFQPAHVMETSEFPKMPEDRRMENSWAVHQVLNTANFAPDNIPISWFIGGLNYQIEHHLFPHVCHVHYPAISGIVKQTAAEFGVSYQELPTFRAALREHKNMLKKLGEKP